MITPHPMIKVVLSFLLIIAASYCCAQPKTQANAGFDPQAAYNEGVSFGEQKKANANDALRNFDTRQLPNFTANPEASKHYGGVTQKTDDLGSSAQTEANKSEAAKTVFNSFAQRPLYKIDKSAAEMQKSQLIVDHAQEIARGQYADCQKSSHKTCKTEYRTDICTEGGRLQRPTCTKELVVAAEKAPLDKELTVSVSLLGIPSKSLWATVDLNSGRIIASNALLRSAKVFPTLADLNCDDIVLDYKGYTSPTVVTVNQQPVCSNNLHATFSLDAGGSALIKSGTATMRYHLYGKPNVQEHWTNNCTWLDQFKGCRLEKEVCSQGKETRNIGGVPITRDCWETTSTYNCEQAPVSDTCQPLRDKGCEQIGSQCASQVGDICTEYQQFFQCPVKKCSTTSGVVCGGKFFCLDGDCSSHDYEKGKEVDLAKGASYLSAMAAAQNEFDDRFIFSGKRATCDNTVLGYNNCCRDIGWGQDIGLAHCSDEEKKLGKDKEKKLTVYVGEYCSKKFLGVCLEHRKTYCSFPSKLARIVQEQGRLNQLGIDFGDAENNTSCRGLSPEEMQRIDFSKIDFSEFYADLDAKMSKPDFGATSQRISDRVREQYEHKK